MKMNLGGDKSEGEDELEDKVEDEVEMTSSRNS